MPNLEALVRRAVTPSGYAQLTGGWMIRQFMWAMTDHRWEGGDYVPRKGGFVVAANHISHIDPIAVSHFLLNCGRTPHFLAKSSLFEGPLLGTWLRLLGQVPVYRDTGRASEAFSAAVADVRNGHCVVVMPESTITKDPDLWPMEGKTGVARIAMETGCPVFPLAQWGAHELLKPYGGWEPWPRKTMRMSFGPAVDLDDLQDGKVTNETLHEVTDRIMADITIRLERLRGEAAPDGRWHPELGRRVQPEETLAASRGADPVQQAESEGVGAGVAETANRDSETRK